MGEIAILLDKATSPLLLEMDWDSTLQVVDLIRQGDISPKQTINIILLKIRDPNPNVVLFALQVLECIVKNCGQVIHEQVATRSFMEQFYEIFGNTTNEDVKKKMLFILATWTHAFRNETKYRAVQDFTNILKAEGYHMPNVSESDAMFTADRAPDWADGENCHRCRSQFTLLRRKHHCRACGQVFCSDCSNKYSTLPKFGIEREVRVCESCYQDINNPRPNSATAASPSHAKQQQQQQTDSDLVPPTSKSSGPPKKSEDELKEEEELQLALALSKSEAENKEKEKLRATSTILGGGTWKPTSPTTTPSPTNLPKDEVMDPELAKYLNRPYWEQQQKVKTDTSPTMPSAPITSAKVASPSKTPTKVNEWYQNGETEEVDEFMATLRSQLEIFVNRMRSNQSRGRLIANDSAVQSLFVNITAMHSQLLKFKQQQDSRRLQCEGLQDKISQIRDARAALEALREEHKDTKRREREEQERQRQLQMMQKLEIMRKKKQEYLEYQRQLAIHRMAESERQIYNQQPPNAAASIPPYGHPYQPPYPGVGPMPGYMYPMPEGGAPPGMNAPPPGVGGPQPGMPGGPQAGMPGGPPGAGGPQPGMTGPPHGIGGPPPHGMGVPPQGSYQGQPEGAPGFQQAPPPTTTQPGFPPPSTQGDYNSFNMAAMSNTLPPVSGYPPGHPQQLPPGNGGVQGPPPSEPPTSPAAQQAELISFD